MGYAFGCDRHDTRSDTALIKFGGHNNFKGANAIYISPAFSIALRIGDRSLNDKGVFDEVLTPISFNRVTAESPSQMQ